MTAMTISRYFHTLKPLRSEQLWWQGKYRLLRSFFPPRKRRPPAELEWRIPEPRTAPFLWPPVPAGTDVKARTFEFLNESALFEQAIDWDASNRSRLWGFLLNYFGFLAVADADSGKEMISDWMERCRSGIGWESGPTSHRIVNWIKFIAEKLSDSENPEFLDRVAADLYIQADWLCRNLERHINGNHLLKNGAALLFAGTFLVNERFLKKGTALLEETVKEQFLPDGGHYERSPMYHVMMLCDLLDCLNLGLEDEALSDLLAETVRQGLCFMDALSHPDGDIALFNDSVLDAAPRPEAVIKYAKEAAEVEIGEGKKEPSVHFPDTGYVLLESGNSRMIVDAGEIGPELFPAHAHCDLLSFELSVSGSRVIVDSGNFDYERGEMREYCRSTRAHNTVSVDGRDQSDMWGVFRVGCRAHPGEVLIEESEKGVTLSASHDGFVKPTGLRHGRRILCFPDETFLIVDFFEGSGTHRMESFLHFHPGCEVTCSEEWGSLIVERAGVKLHVHGGLAGGEAAIEKGWYCPSFGVRLEQQVLAMTLEAELPAVMACCLETSGQGPSRLKEELEKLICAS